MMVLLHARVQLSLLYMDVHLGLGSHTRVPVVTPPMKKTFIVSVTLIKR